MATRQKFQEDTTACDILREYHNDIKNDEDDDQHLPLEVMEGVLGRKCAIKPHALYTAKNKYGVLTESELLENHKKFMNKAKRLGTSFIYDDDKELRKKKSIKPKTRKSIKKCKCK
jgi:hypothetical protein